MTKGINLSKEDLKTFQDEFQNAIKQNRDPREIAYQEIVKYLFDDTKLLFVSRVNEDQIRRIMYNKIVISFYQDYYASLWVKIKLVKTKIPPYYKKVVDYSKYSADIRKKFLKKYDQYIDDFMSILVSLKGKGRDEGLKILENSNEKLEQKLMQRGLT